MRFDFVRLVLFLLFLGGLSQTFFDIFFDKLFVLFGVGFGHLIEHLPNIVGHIHILGVFEAEHLL